jgi:hypothetical protein
MTPRTEAIGLIGITIALALMIELVRRRRLRIGYSLLWLFTGLLALILILFEDLVRVLSQLIGIRSPTSLLFTAGIVFALLILLGNSITLTTLWRQNKSLAQELAMLEWRLRQLQIPLQETGSPPLPMANPCSEQITEKEIHGSN